jgi:RimJ/RimL family protein N-acetyltransferase
MFSDGVVDLIRSGNITGRYKRTHPRKVSASFTFGTRKVYDFVDRNPLFTFHPSDYINNPMRIAEQHKMVAVNSALQIDLTGQVCADSIGTRFYSGIGGQVDFIRGASMCPDGKPIIALPSTAVDGGISRIVGTLDVGAGVVTSRGDVRFVVTEHGIADLLGKSIRERAMALISIAHPDFRRDLLTAAKQRRYVFSDQIEPRPGYPRQYEKTFTTNKGRTVLMRPIRVTDEQKLVDFFYNLSNQTIYKRWMHVIKSMPHKDILHYLDVDYRQTMAIIVEYTEAGQEPELIGVGRYHGDRATNRAEVAFVIRDDWQGQGLGSELLRELIRIARDNGISALTADVLADNHLMMHVFHRCGLDVKSVFDGGVYSLTIALGAAGNTAAE